MVMRLFLLYAVVELAVIVALVSTIGFGWTVLLVLATFVLGLALAGSQLRRQIRRLQSGLTAATVHGAVADSALVALGTVLVVIPGVASSVLGALLLLPPTRAAARPLVTAMAARRMPLVTVGAAAPRLAATRRGSGDYIDGEVIDVTTTARRRAAGRGAQARLSDDTADNGRVHSPAMPDATAMAVRDGTVAWLGADDVGRAQFPDAQIVDLDGGFVAPAFVDSHVHLTATGLTLAGLDLRAATSLRHCLALVGDYADAHPDGPIWGHGWDESGWPERTPPSTADLDGVVGDRPAYLARVDVHSAAASTALRRLAPGLPRPTGSPRSGR